MCFGLALFQHHASSNHDWNLSEILTLPQDWRLRRLRISLPKLNYHPLPSLHLPESHFDRVKTLNVHFDHISDQEMRYLFSSGCRESIINLNFSFSGGISPKALHESMRLPNVKQMSVSYGSLDDTFESDQHLAEGHDLSDILSFSPKCEELYLFGPLATASILFKPTNLVHTLTLLLSPSIPLTDYSRAVANPHLVMNVKKLSVQTFRGQTGVDQKEVDQKISQLVAICNSRGISCDLVD